MAVAGRMWLHIEGMGPINKCITDSGKSGFSLSELLIWKGRKLKGFWFGRGVADINVKLQFISTYRCRDKHR